MARIFEDNSLSIGNTPLIRLNRITAGLPGIVVVKTEGRNPAYSVKCRIGASMIWAAEREGILKRGSNNVTIVEPTSGNTGIALAYVAASRGICRRSGIDGGAQGNAGRNIKGRGNPSLRYEKILDASTV